jgi:hypothetical protein
MLVGVVMTPIQCARCGKFAALPKAVVCADEATHGCVMCGFTFKAFFVDEDAAAFLTRAQQRVMHRALRRSLRIIA